MKEVVPGMTDFGSRHLRLEIEQSKNLQENFMPAVKIWGG